MAKENEEDQKKHWKWFRKNPKVDEKVQQAITQAEEFLNGSLEPATIRELDGSQRKLIHEHFEKTQEYKVKSYREKESEIIKIYPVGQLKRLAEQKTQEVLMKGKPEDLPPMGSYQRFVIHDYLKDREGVKTESFGEKGKDRHVEILPLVENLPLFGRNLKKVKHKLI